MKERTTQEKEDPKVGGFGFAGAARTIVDTPDAGDARPNVGGFGHAGIERPAKETPKESE